MSKEIKIIFNVVKLKYDSSNLWVTGKQYQERNLFQRMYA